MKKTPFIVRDLTDPTYGARPDTGFLENFGVGVDSGLDMTTWGILNRIQKTRTVRVPGAAISPEEFERSYYKRAGVEFSPGMSWEAAQAILDARTNESILADVTSRSTGWGKVGEITGGLVGGLADPINLIPFGGGMTALGKGLATAVIREGAINAVMEAAITPFEAVAREREQNPLTVREGLANIAMAYALGGFLGGLGHGVGRLAERSRAFSSGYEIDGNGNITPSAATSQTLPDDTPVFRPTPAYTDVRGSLASSMTPEQREIFLASKQGEIRIAPEDRTAEFTRRDASTAEARAKLTDEELIRASVGRGMRDQVEVIKTRRGERVVIDKESGEVLSPTVIERDITDSLASEVERDWKKIKASDPTRAEARMARDRILGDKQIARARDSKRTRRLDQDETPDGVLMTRNRKGNETKIKEVSLEEYWRQTLNDAVEWGRAESELRANQDMPEYSMYNGISTVEFPRGSRFRQGKIEDRMARLTREQFDYLVDWIAPTRHLNRIAKELGIEVRGDTTKRELGDLIFRNLHQRPLNEPNPKRILREPRKRPTAAESITKAVEEKTAADVAERIYRARKHYLEEPAQAMDAEQGIDQVTPDNLVDTLLGHSTISAEKLLAERPEARAILAEAEKLRKKKPALVQAISCLLGG